MLVNLNVDPHQGFPVWFLIYEYLRVRLQNPRYLNRLFNEQDVRRVLKDMFHQNNNISFHSESMYFQGDLPKLNCLHFFLSLN